MIEEAGLWVTDLEVLRLHYAETLREWRRRFVAQRAEIAALYDERFCRMWEFYLISSEAGFRWFGMMNFQIQLTPAGGRPAHDPRLHVRRRAQAGPGRHDGRQRRMGGGGVGLISFPHAVGECRRRRGGGRTAQPGGTPASPDPSVFRASRGPSTAFRGLSSPSAMERGRRGSPKAQPCSLAVTSATWRPWKRAAPSSSSVGLRAPSPPAMVVAP